MLTGLNAQKLLPSAGDNLPLCLTHQICHHCRMRDLFATSGFNFLASLSLLQTPDGTEEFSGSLGVG
ncbi:hypothetical protein [Klebsiella pneumoniae]|uniref:hypothetical protein n=1 Tax=Klebsiella pneumoniae TaxID=573 RepID=UPI0022B69F53|nr:hypothetical protein [Klebsiella pneumoniae]